MYAELALGALALLRQLAAENRPPTQEEVDALDAKLAAERSEFLGKLDDIESRGQTEGESTV